MGSLGVRFSDLGGNHKADSERTSRGNPKRGRPELVLEFSVFLDILSMGKPSGSLKPDL